MRRSVATCRVGFPFPSRPPPHRPPPQDLFQGLNANLALNGLFHVEAHRAAAVDPSAARAEATRRIPTRDPSLGRSNFGSFSLLEAQPGGSISGVAGAGGGAGGGSGSVRTTAFELVTLDGLSSLAER